MTPCSNGAWVFTNRTWPKDTAVRSLLLSPFLPRTDLAPARAQYVGHRFTNGPVYSEYIAQTLGVPLVSYGEPSSSPLGENLPTDRGCAATGGASISHRVSSRSGEHGMLPVDCILDQIAKYSIGKKDESATLFIVYAGANDAYFSLDEGGTPAEVVDDLKLAVQALKDIGAFWLSRVFFRMVR